MGGIESAELILLRHGESVSNAEGLFTGVLDSPLSDTGVAEVHRAADELRTAGFRPDVVFSSTLQRSTHTAVILLEDLHSTAIPRYEWRLNERNYGSLTGLSKPEVKAEFGDEQFRLWRRSVDVAPPPMGDELFRRLSRSELFRHLPPQALTRTESLADVIGRLRGFWDDILIPLIERGERILVVGHGNSLRALSAIIDRLDKNEVSALNIPTGHALRYTFTADFRPVTRGGDYLNPAQALAAADALANQGGT